MRVSLYRQMLRLRIAEETIASRYPESKMRCPVHLSIGQEGVAVGVCATLEPRDRVFSTHRAHVHYLAKGGSLEGLVAELYGKVGGCAKGIGGSMHLVDLAVGFMGAVPIVGSTIPIAVGAAWGTRQAGEDRVTVCFLGDGATEEGVFHESLNFAALKSLPVVFVCENNLYSVYTGLQERQAKGRDLGAIVRGHGLEYVKGDGQDAEEVLRLTRPAVERARRGAGPSLVELSCYRWREHCGPNYDDDLGYRPKGELASWQARCCVKLLGDRLLASKEASAAQLAGWRRESEAEAAQAFRFAEESPFPGPEQLAMGAYATRVPTEGSQE